MSSFELNKIIGSVLGVILLILVINNLGDIFYHEQEVDAHANVNIILDETISENKERVITTKDKISNIEERLAIADINEGEKYIKKCGVCHSFKNDGKNKLGPNLYNVFNRKIASMEGFSYSKALKDIGSNWNENNLDSFLLSPKKWVPGTKMVFVGIKNDQERANVIKYLQILN